MSLCKYLVTVLAIAGLGACSATIDETEIVEFPEQDVTFEIQSDLKGGTANNEFHVYMISDAGREIVFSARGGGKPELDYVANGLFEIRYEGGYWYQLWVTRNTQQYDGGVEPPKFLAFTVDTSSEFLAVDH